MKFIGVKMKNLFIMLILFTISENSFSCPNKGSFFGSYKPIMSPVEFSIDSKGIKISTSDEILTLFGEFKIG